MVLYPASDRKKDFALRTSAHAIGTAKAMEMGEVEGAMSSLAIVVSGLCTVVCASVFANFYKMSVEEEAETVLSFIASVQEERQRRYIRRISLVLTLKSCLYRRKRNKMKESPV